MIMTAMAMVVVLGRCCDGAELRIVTKMTLILAIMMVVYMMCDDGCDAMMASRRRCDGDGCVDDEADVGYGDALIADGRCDDAWCYDEDGDVW